MGSDTQNTRFYYKNRHPCIQTTCFPFALHSSSSVMMFTTTQINHNPVYLSSTQEGAIHLSRVSSHDLFNSHL